MPNHKIYFTLTWMLAMILLTNGCSKVNEIEIEIAESVRSNSTSELKVIRTGTGSGEWDIADKDGFNYYFSSHPAGKFDVEILKGEGK